MVRELDRESATPLPGIVTPPDQMPLFAAGEQVRILRPLPGRSLSRADLHPGKNGRG